VPSRDSNIPPGFVRVYSTFVQSQIVVAKLALESEGIEFFTRGETWAGVYPGLDGMATVDFLVKKEDAAEATEALKSLIEGKSNPEKESDGEST